VAVALKCLKVGPSVVGPQREKFLERFLLEGQLLHRLSRGNAAIVQALDVGVEVAPSGQWVPYLVLEWLEGRSLAADFEERMRAGLEPRPLPEAIECLDPAVEALDYAHGQGIAHRDIKPDNLFLAFVGGALTLKVLDFGIAKVVEDAAMLTPGAGSVTHEGRPFTPGYAAPEQFNPNLGSTGPWTDVYSLALVLLQTVTGRKAIQGASNLELHTRALDPERRPSFVGLGVSVPDAVERVVARALAVDPRNRYRRASEFWDALRPAASEAPRAPIPAAAHGAAFEWTQTETGASPSSATGETHDTLEEARPASAPVQTLGTDSPATPMRQPRVKRWQLAAGGAALLLAIAFAGLIGWGGSPDAGESITPSELDRELVASHRSRAPTSSLPNRVLVDGGTFTMGSDSGEQDEAPAHRVTVSSFRIGQTEVSVGEYQRCVDARRCDRPATNGRCQGTNARSDFPVVCVDWSDARRFCDWDHGWLPTEAEWEFAARGVDERTYPWGSERPDCTRADFEGTRDDRGSCNGPGPSPVTSHADGATPSDVLNLAGNVWEWVSDWYGAYPALRTTDPTGPEEGRQRVTRGGTWGSPGVELRTTERWALDPGLKRWGVGFRCAYPAADGGS
jgi:formylglycine-generating enzyme required for sulfatase activity